MISKEMKDMLNQQINMEMYSGYLYLDMANYYIENGLDGFAHWYTLQAAEEWDHAMRFRTFCQDNGVKVVFEAIAKPDLTYADYREPLVEGLAHEKEITASIHKMYDQATKDGDYLTMQILDWFVAEQSEEELNATINVESYDLFADGDKNGLLSLNRKMAARSE